MENKYYIPHIDEFTSDFHYEYFNEKVWIKSSNFTNDWDYEDNPHYAIMKGIDNGIIRVKYLDASGIEELGFKKIIKDQYYYDGWINPITLLIDDDMFVQIINKCNGTEYYLFQGTIKNKSELKKVLNMLNIK